MRFCSSSPVRQRCVWLVLAVGMFGIGSPVLGGSNLPLDDSMSEVSISVAEQATGREFIRSARSRFRFVDDPLVLDVLRQIGARLSSTLAGDTEILTFHLIENSQLNAFAGPGGHIGVFTGLITATESEAELASVIAHELAHVTQRHLPRMIERAQQRQIPATAGMIAAILLGGQAGAATMAVTNAAAISDQLSYTRAFEREADALGLKILNAAGYDPEAMARFLQRLAQSSRFQDAEIPEYFRTHPLSSNRIAEMEGRTVNYPSVVDEASPNFLHAQARITAIYGDDAERAIEQFRHRIASDTGAASRAARYGLALAALKTGEFEVAIEQAHRLWESDPDDPFYVVGLAESYQGRGDISTALGVLAADYPVDADDPVLSSYYADALIKAGKPAKAKPVIRAGLRAAPHSIVLFRLLARAEGELGRLAESFQALAETHYLSGDLGLALEKLELAVKHTGNSAYLKASIAARQAEIRQELGDQKG